MATKPMLHRHRHSRDLGLVGNITWVVAVAAERHVSIGQETGEGMSPLAAALE